MPTQDIFPTKIYQAVPPNVDIIQTEIEHVLPLLEFNRSGKPFGHANNLTTMQDNLIGRYQLKNLGEALEFHIKQYCLDLEFEFKPYRCFSWFTRNEPGDYLQIHHHNDVDITGTYYYQTNGNDGDFFFESPVAPAPHSICFSSQHHRLYIKPEVGKIILFPGWIRHGVLTNTSDTDRIGISFNISFMR
jgi:uncharacterized protein (TIGR02466 family)